ncbi:hypothetical protein MNBD_GAMMA01-323 [hydrothermal vent metagenome]|uniref:ABC transporter domain-containing protein n=1 Tax=hydrothermal vent metagenome TaxID=652676 RepID=A0A3B0VB61_9ZZZZ
MMEIKNLAIEIAGKTLITDLNIELNPGEFWAILGKNGTGKTTLLHTLAGLLKYNTGSIKINDRELTTFSAISRAQNIALLSQLLEAGLNCTVKQAISYGRYPWHKCTADKHTDQQAIATAINHMQLNELQDSSIQQISGGELRKVEIATILAQDSEIMLLDEPLNHLDMAFRYKLMQLLKQLSDKKLIIIVTHDIQYVQAYCSHVIMLVNDNQTIIGKTKEVINPKNLNTMLGVSLADMVYQVMIP